MQPTTLKCVEANNFMSEKMHKVIPDKRGDMCMDKKTKIYPTFQLDSEDLPELKDFKVGDKISLCLDVEQLSMRQGSEWQGADTKDKKIYATFKIINVGVDEPDELTYGQEYAQRMSPKK